MKPQQQKTAAILGTVLFITGIILYFVEPGTPGKQRVSGDKADVTCSGLRPRGRELPSINCAQPKEPIEGHRDPSGPDRVFHHGNREFTPISPRDHIPQATALEVSPGARRREPAPPFSGAALARGGCCGVHVRARAAEKAIAARDGRRSDQDGAWHPVGVGQSIEFKIDNGRTGFARRTLVLKVTQGSQDEVDFGLRRG